MDKPVVKSLKNILNGQPRPEQIRDLYAGIIDEHLDDLVNNRVSEMMGIEEFADKMCMHPTHLSNTIKNIAGVSACEIFQTKQCRI